jgi:hypothetical protein
MECHFLQLVIGVYRLVMSFPAIREDREGIQLETREQTERRDPGVVVELGGVMIGPSPAH